MHSFPESSWRTCSIKTEGATGAKGWHNAERDDKGRPSEWQQCPCVEGNQCRQQQARKFRKSLLKKMKSTEDLMYQKEYLENWPRVVGWINDEPLLTARKIKHVLGLPTYINLTINQYAVNYSKDRKIQKLCLCWGLGRKRGPAHHVPQWEVNNV